MEEFVGYLANNRDAFYMAIVLFFALLLAMQWVMWLWGIGRYRAPETYKRRGENLSYLLTTGLVKIINEFRHLFALLVVVIFGLALAYSLYQAGENITDIKEALQSVTATLGGLVGTIIGYYFGESTAKRGGGDDDDSGTDQPAGEAVQGDGPDGGPAPAAPEVPARPASLRRGGG